MVFTLLQHPPAWDLPSIDPACIEAQVYLRLAAVDFAVESVPTRAGAEQIPALEDGDEVVMANESGGIQAYLREHKGIDLNNALTAAERADAEAFTALVESRLQEALQYSLWLEEENYRAYRQVYGAALPFPLNRILAYVALKKLEAQFKSQEIDRGLIRAEVYRHAEQAYSALAAKLGDQRYFFGDRPTSLDAVVLAHLLFLEKAKLGEPSLKNKAFSHPNLSQYVKRLGPELFPATPPETAREAPPFTRSPVRSSKRWWWGGKVQKEEKRSEEEQKFRSRARYFVVAQVVAILAHVIFSSLEVEDVELEEEYDED